LTGKDNIRTCLDLCSRSLGDLRGMADSEPNPINKVTLNEGAHHLDLCVLQCHYSLAELGG